MSRVRPSGAPRASLALLLGAGCSAPSALERALQREFDPRQAIRVELLDGVIRIDGSAVAPEQVSEVIAKARQDGEERRSALVTVALQPREGEGWEAFERRADQRKQEALELLFEAGIRQIQLGPPGPAGPRP